MVHDRHSWETWGFGDLVALRLVDEQLCESCRRPDLIVTMTTETLDELPLELREVK